MEFFNLANKPEHLETVARWQWDEWCRDNGYTLEEIIYRTRNSMKTNDIPQTWVVLQGDELIGTFSLWNCDLFNRQDLRPWIACVIVKPEHRNKGLGSAMTKKGVEIVRGLGYKNMYLITHHEGYYEKLGWEFMETAPFKGSKTIRLYKKEII